MLIEYALSAIDDALYLWSAMLQTPTGRPESAATDECRITLIVRQTSEFGYHIESVCMLWSVG